MNILQLFKRNQTLKKQDKESLDALRRRISRSQEAVYSAVEEMGVPVNGITVARHMGIDSASVTPRLAELVRKRRLRIAYSKRGLDGVWRRFYVIRRLSRESTRRSGRY